MKETANISVRSVYSLSVLSSKDIKTIERALKGLITTFVGRFDGRYRKVIGRYRHAKKIARESSAVDLLFMSHRLEPRTTLSVFLCQTASGCNVSRGTKRVILRDNTCVLRHA